MKRSFLTVTAAALFAIAACGGDDTDVNIEPVEDMAPPPPPAPAQPMPMDTMPMDTTLTGDTLGATTTSM